jgi:hypothetical protein
MMTWLAGVLLVTFAAAAYVGYLGWYLWWEGRQTAGLAYYGRSVADRRALKRRIRLFSRPALPAVRALARASQESRTMPTFEFEGVSGPPRVSSPEVFARAKAYEPRPGDVFVATQMRCGTTWMQQIVYSVLTRGQGDFDGHQRHLYTLSPWIDATTTVSIEEAPRVGEPPSRIIKTHLPADLCPRGRQAKYIYVARHPVSCFASIVEFNRSMLGPLLPSVDRLVDWYCSDRMYWRPWPAHVAGWWERAERDDNVLFVHFEEMARDFAAVRDRVARFLGCELTVDEARRVDRQCSFEYMKRHEESFEMAPPSMFSVAGGQFLARGSARRADELTPELRVRIAAYCRQQLRGRSYPIGLFYPDLAVEAHAHHAAVS